jgi:hypothetical protein
MRMTKRRPRRAESAQTSSVRVSLLPAAFAQALAAGNVKKAVGELVALRAEFPATGKLRADHYARLAIVAHAYDVARGPDLESYQEELNAELERACGYPSKSIMRLLARTVIPYPEGEEAKGDNQKALSRDVRALRYLRRRKVRPDQIAAEAAKPGQGVEAWSRAYALARRTETEGARAITRRSRPRKPKTHPRAATLEDDPRGSIPPQSLRLIWTGANGEILEGHTLPLTLDADGEPDRRSWTAATTFFRRLETNARRKAAIAAAGRGGSDNDE